MSCQIQVYSHLSLILILIRLLLILIHASGDGTCGPAPDVYYCNTTVMEYGWEQMITLPFDDHVWYTVCSYSMRNDNASHATSFTVP